MTGLTLRQLRYFEALARIGHFGRAAEACSISQPALSVQIRELEETLGLKLFERSARSVRLTAFGIQFKERVRPILQAVDELPDLARAAQKKWTGSLKIGVIPTVAPYLLPAILGDLKARHPELDIQVRESLTDRLLRELSAGQLDTAIVALPISEPSFHEVSLFDEKFLFVRPESEASNPAPTHTSLELDRLLLLEEGHCFRDQALSFCSLSKGSATNGLDGSSLATLVQMVAAGLGVTVIPEMAVDVETRGASVSVVRFAGPEPSRSIGMIWRKSNPLADKLELIADIVSNAGDRHKPKMKEVLK